MYVAVVSEALLLESQSWELSLLPVKQAPISLL